MNFSKITIIGLGLIGGSLAWALKKSGQVGEVCGVDLDKSAIDYAVQEGIIDKGSTELGKQVSDSEIIVIATHVGVIPKIGKTVASIASPGATITDVGSVKGRVVREMEKVMPDNIHFVGGHPIAGTEQSGIWASNSELFKDRRCILTPNARTNIEALGKVKNLWESVGANVSSMDAKTHDRIFGFVSHLPHVVAYALVNSVASQKNPDNMLDFGGGGLRDYTRIGASSPDMWSDIFLGNKESVLESITEFKKALEAIEKYITDENFSALKEELSKAAKSKESLK